MKLVVVLLAAGCASPATNPVYTLPVHQQPANVATPNSAFDTGSELTRQETAPTPNALPGEQQSGQIQDTTLGSQHATQVAAIVPPAPKRAPPEAKRLLVATSAVAFAPPEPARLADALERVADALALVAPEQMGDIARIRESAAALESGPDDGTHAASARTALVAAGNALRAIPIDLSTADGLHVRDAADFIVQQAETIDPSKPLVPQYQPVREALRASTEAVYGALHVPQPPLPGQG